MGRGWEEPAWVHARFARVILCREKIVGLRPATRWGHLLFLLGRNGHDGSVRSLA